jgi:hypothetical protein
MMITGHSYRIHDIMAAETIFLGITWLFSYTGLQYFATCGQNGLIGHARTVFGILYHYVG